MPALCRISGSDLESGVTFHWRDDGRSSSPRYTASYRGMHAPSDRAFDLTFDWGLGLTHFDKMTGHCIWLY